MPNQFAFIYPGRSRQFTELKCGNEASKEVLLPRNSPDGKSWEFPPKLPSRFPRKMLYSVYPGNSRPTYQVNVLKIDGSEWKYKVVKLHQNLRMCTSKLAKKYIDLFCD